MKDEIDGASGENRLGTNWIDGSSREVKQHSLFGAVSEWVRRRVRPSDRDHQTLDASATANEIDRQVTSAAKGVVGDRRAPDPSSDRARVLYAESNFVRAQFFAELLRIEGVLPDIALSGPDVVARAEETPYGLVLLETGLADGSLSAARAIREIERRTRRPRSMIICFSSSTPVTAVPVLDGADIDAYTAGPLRLEHVLPALGRQPRR